ncbi:rhodanese-like domain-containing protein [Peptoniphilus indolicus]|uniref:rhodanese-like domain-containing protein n=1 Tax=Peptoniphilus indolicus TaxID=33030 RepID=UPI00211C80F5|nr:rhodanese-like domain-containing protein [Peptoniphilus indolicus]
MNKNKNNSDFVIFDVRTKGEYDESHIKGSIQSNFYNRAEFESYLKTLDKDKTYLIYCRTDNRSKEAAKLMQGKGFNNIYVMLGGMTKWLIGDKEHVSAKFEKKLSVNLKSLTTEINKVKVEVKVLDPNLNARVKSKVKIEILEDNNLKHEEDFDMNNKEVITKEFILNVADTSSFTIKATASEDGWEDGIATIPVSSRNVEFKSFDEVKESKFFIHFKQNDREKTQIKKVYGNDVTNYNARNYENEVITLKDILNKDKKTMLLFGYPGCGGCKTMMEEMSNLISKYPKFTEKYNFYVVVTSVEENTNDTIELTNKTLDEMGAGNLKEVALYDSETKIWASKLGLKTTPNILLLDEAGRIVNLSPQLSQNGLKDLFKKTFNDDIEVVNDENQAYDIYTEGGDSWPYKAKAGREVALYANENEKRKFVRWESNRPEKVTFNNPNSKKTSFIMPDIEVIIRAVYK